MTKKNYERKSNECVFVIPIMSLCCVSMMSKRISLTFLHKYLTVVNTSNLYTID